MAGQACTAETRGLRGAAPARHRGGWAEPHRTAAQSRASRRQGFGWTAQGGWALAPGFRRERRGHGLLQVLRDGLDLRGGRAGSLGQLPERRGAGAPGPHPAAPAEPGRPVGDPPGRQPRGPDPRRGRLQRAGKWALPGIDGPLGALLLPADTALPVHGAWGELSPVLRGFLRRRAARHLRAGLRGHRRGSAPRDRGTRVPRVLHRDREEP
mmetsp:Transcript_3098/g.8594  ORF Transcript_3098/g.8594 Transcript_3098/m.8594 type:complete len:211 (-) Transcript_3098:87-719(-)